MVVCINGPCLFQGPVGPAGREGRQGEKGAKVREKMLLLAIKKNTSRVWYHVLMNHAHSCLEVSPVSLTPISSWNVLICIEISVIWRERKKISSNFELSLVIRSCYGCLPSLHACYQNALGNGCLGNAFKSKSAPTLPFLSFSVVLQTLVQFQQHSKAKNNQSNKKSWGLVNCFVNGESKEFFHWMYILYICQEKLVGCLAD